MARLADDCFRAGAGLLALDTALELMRSRIEPVRDVETVPLTEADGRVLAEDLIAARPLPGFTNSAVDGWGLRHADLLSGSPTELARGARVAAGQAVRAPCPPGAAVRLFTGAPVPPGVDTVVMQEDVGERSGGIVVPAGVARGANLRLAGEDLPAGEVALRTGRRLAPQDLALAAAVGAGTLAVRRRPAVALFSTGEELAEPGAPLRDAAIHDLNRVMLAGLLRRLGCAVSDLGILRDRADAVAARLAQSAEAHDLVLTSGGVSVGEEDHVRRAVERVGTLVFWRLAIRPGRPVAMGVVGGTPFIGLPGNPVASFVAFVALVRPFVERLCGAEAGAPRAVPVRADFAYAKPAGRRDYLRANLRQASDGMLEAVIFPKQGTGMVTSLTRTDGLIELDETCVSVAPGQFVQFLPYGLLS